MWCQECRLDYGKRYVIRNEQGTAIRVLCDRCRTPQPPRPRWFDRLTAKDMTGSAA